MIVVCNRCKKDFESMFYSSDSNVDYMCKECYEGYKKG